MRLFFAAWPPAGAAKALVAWARDLARDCGGRPTREETVHLTLAFLGEADPDVARANGRAVKAPALEFRIEQARYWAHNRIVWAGPREAPAALASLAAALGEAGRFAAHVTLIRKARPPRVLPPPPMVAWPVQEFVLVRSTLASRGPDYEVLERFALG
jgi:2'-5' RNA ligase